VVASKCDLSVLSWVPFFISKLYFREIREATTDLAFARLGLYIVLFKDVKHPFQVYVILFSVVSDQDVVNASSKIHQVHQKNYYPYLSLFDVDGF